MLQEQAIQLSMQLQSNANGGIFQHLTNINGIWQIMFSSWLLNIYLIILPIFLVFSVFLLLQTIRGWNYFRYPALRYVLPVVLILFCMSGVLVFVQLSEIKADVDKAASLSDIYGEKILTQVINSVRNAKSSFINALKAKKTELFVVVEKLLTETLIIADKVVRNPGNSSLSGNFSVNFVSRNVELIEIYGMMAKFANQSVRVSGTLFGLKRDCNKDWIKLNAFCKFQPNECKEFLAALKQLTGNTEINYRDNQWFAFNFQTLLPMVRDVLEKMDLVQVEGGLDGVFDTTLDKIAARADKVIDDKLRSLLKKQITILQPKIQKKLIQVQVYLRWGIFILLITVVVYVSFLLVTVILNQLAYSKCIKPENNSTQEKKMDLPILERFVYSWRGPWHFCMFLVGAGFLLAFVVVTTLLMNTQTEICRYLSDTGNAAQIADSHINQFLKLQGRVMLETMVPQNVLRIPKLNIKNPEQILSTIVRDCPAQKILLPSLQLYRPLNTTALIFSDFVENEILKPELVKIQKKIDKKFQKIYSTIKPALDKSNMVIKKIVDVFFPTYFQMRFKNLESIENFMRLTKDDNHLLELSRMKVKNNNLKLTKYYESVLRYDRKELSGCFNSLSEILKYYENDKLLVKILDKINYFKNLILTIADLLDRVNATLAIQKEKFLHTLLEHIVEPLKLYTNEFLNILEDETLAQVIPCRDLGKFYLDTVKGVCTDQLGNVLVLSLAATICFSLGCILILMIMVAY